MTKLDIMNNITRTFHKVGFGLKKHSPEILVVSGVAGVVVSTVLACKATTKASAIIERTKGNIDDVHKCLENPELASEYTEEDSKKDIAIIYTQAGLELAKTYAPAIIVGTLSIAAILTGHNILHKRNIALAAAYTAMDKSFKDYRGRVIDRFGEELDKELKYNLTSKEIEEVVVDEEGNEQTVKKTVSVAPSTMHSPYARFFDDGCIGWEKNAEYNHMFLNQQQNYANEKLQKKGYLFLNEVYEMLGIPISEAGQCVGWIYDEKNPIGDNYVDFGMYDVYNEKARDFVNGYERTILLDFNVDGNILKYI